MKAKFKIRRTGKSRGGGERRKKKSRGRIIEGKIKEQRIRKG